MTSTLVSVARPTARIVAGVTARPARRAAVVDLRAPSLAVWRGEVVVVASPERATVSALLRAATARPDAPLGVAEPRAEYEAPHAPAALAALALSGGAVLAGVVLRPSPLGRRALAALRLTVARHAPCRCVWLVDGRVYPE